MLPETVRNDIARYIDRHYVAEQARGIYGPEDEVQCPQKLKLYAASCIREDMAPCASAPVPKGLSLSELLEQADAGFSETLLDLIDASGQKDSAIYKKAHVSKQHFSKIRNNPNHKPNKETAIAFALALELDVAQTNDLIGRAGYTLSNSSKFDLIIRYFIERRQYDIVQINLALYEFDQTLLGS